MMTNEGGRQGPGSGRGLWLAGKATTVSQLGVKAAVGQEVTKDGREEVRLKGPVCKIWLNDF